MPNHVLLIDNDLDTCKEIKYNLDCDNIDVYYCLTAQAGMKMLAEQVYELVILSASIPETDGLELLKAVSQLHNMPILFLSATGDLNEKIEALYHGADAYLAKPLDAEELFAHIHALVRRYTGDLQHKNTRSYILMPFHNLVIHMDKRMVLLEGNRLELTRREFDTLVLFAKHPGQRGIFMFDKKYSTHTNLFGILQTAYYRVDKRACKPEGVILSRLVDTFSTRILQPMQLSSGNHSIADVSP